MPSTPVKGLPEGVEFVEFGIAGPADFELVAGQVFKGARPAAASGVLVKPAEGWEFIPSKGTFDIKSFLLIPGPPNLYKATRVMPSTVVTATVKFIVADSAAQSVVQSALKQLESVPGYQSATITTTPQ